VLDVAPDPLRQGEAHSMQPLSNYFGFLSVTETNRTIVFVYWYLVDGRHYLTVDFGSSSGEAVLKFYPAVGRYRTSTDPFVCLHFDAYLTSSAVRLEVAVSNMSVDSTNNTTRSDKIDIRYRQRDRRQQSVTVLHGQQYVVFTATKIRVTEMPDYVKINDIYDNDGHCGKYNTRKYRYTIYRLTYTLFELLL